MKIAVYQLQIQFNNQELQIPCDKNNRSVIYCINQGNYANIYIPIDNNCPPIKRTFKFFKTMEDVDTNIYYYVGNVWYGPYIYFLFELM